MSKKISKLRDKVAFIIPVYNEEEVIGGVVDKVLREYDYVVCINDGSRDNSAEEISKTKAFLVDHPINMGQGAALQTGIDFAKQLPVDYFVTFDADGQHRLEDVQHMLEEITKTKADVILGSRFLGKAAVGMKTSKRIILKLAITFSNYTSGLKLTDTHNGLRVLNRKAAESMQITLSDMSHASEILEIIKSKKLKYREIPVTIEYTEYSMKKGQSMINAINIAFDTLLRKIAK